MTMVSVTYILIAPEGFGLSHIVSYWLGGGVTLFGFILFARYAMQYKKANFFGE
jgi:hypothetical protein